MRVLLGQAQRIGFVVACLSTSLCGCSHLRVDPDGTRHITGFVAMTLPPEDRRVGADAVRLQTLGLALVQGHPACSQLSLGYSDTSIVAVGQDSVVSATALQRVLRGERMKGK